MAIVISLEEAVEHRFPYKLAAGDTGWVNHHLGKLNHPAGASPARVSGHQDDFSSFLRDGIYLGRGMYPVAFEVVQDPGQVAGVHFHQADQFQVILASDGKFGQKPVERPVIHFAAACSAYGPLISGAQELKYFTLRNDWEPGGLHLPEHRPQDFRAGRKPRSAQAVLPHDASYPVDAFEALPVIPLDASGLFATYYKLPEGVHLTAKDQRAGRGQFWLVLSGTCVVQSREVGAGGLWFISPDEPEVTMQGGTSGATLVAMQFPHPTDDMSIH